MVRTRSELVEPKPEESEVALPEESGKVAKSEIVEIEMAEADAVKAGAEEAGTAVALPDTPAEDAAESAANADGGPDKDE